MSQNESLDRAPVQNRNSLRLCRSTLIVSTAAVLGIVGATACSGADSPTGNPTSTDPTTTATTTPTVGNGAGTSTDPTTTTTPAPTTTTSPAPTTTTTAPAPTSTTTAPAPTSTTTPAPTSTTPTPAPTATAPAPTPAPTTTAPAPAPTPAPTTTAPAPAPAPTPVATTEYAPYFYTWGWGNSAYTFTSLADMKSKVGTPAVTLAFVLGTGSCQTTTDIQSHMSDVKAFIAAGGRVKASFGGAGGTYLENTCGSASAMASALTSFVDATGITDLDFDVEQSVAETSSINTMRAQALAAVQKSRGIKVAFTLPATTSGISAETVPVVQAALDAGVTISHVNLMTMDYGGSATGTQESARAISSANGCASQLQSMIPGLSSASAYAMVGITAMIGQNDVSSEYFTLADAQAVVAFAKAKGIGLLSFWAIQRDVPCSGGVDLSTCSNSQSGNYQYDAIFRTVLN